MIPNKPLEDDPLVKYQVPPSFIESKVGTKFLGQLQHHKVECTCTYIYMCTKVLSSFRLWTSVKLMVASWKPLDRSNSIYTQES